MTNEADTRLLALLVHRGLLSKEDAVGAMQARDPGEHLVNQGAVTLEQWEEWVATEGGTKPVLTRYEVGDLVGEGGTARVFRAVDRTDGKEVALKVLRPDLASDRRQVEQFVREARQLLDLDCDHIVRGLRVAKEGSVFFFAMELLDGECLQDVLARDGRIGEEEALEAVVQIARALAYLHQNGLVHRDVKPGNVIRDRDGTSVLIDLGFAVRADEVDAEEADTTAGTAAYIAPEQARGKGDLDARADIYALGATLYHLVTGSLPFDGGSSEEILRKQVLESLSGERIRELGLSPQTHFYIEKMMAKEKEIRFQSPLELADEIQGWLDQRRRERERPDKPKGPSRRRRRLF